MFHSKFTFLKCCYVARCALHISKMGSVDIVLPSREIYPDSTDINFAAWILKEIRFAITANLFLLLTNNQNRYMRKLKTYDSNNWCKGTGILGWFQELCLILVGVVATREVICDKIRGRWLEYVVNRVLHAINV